MEKQRSDQNWVTLKEFRNPQGNLVVVVRRADMGDGYRWSIQVGNRKQGHDRPSPYIPVHFFNDDSGIQVQDVTSPLVSLLIQAQAFIREDANNPRDVDYQPQSYRRGPSGPVVEHRRMASR